MTRKVLAGLAAFGLMGPAGAQEAQPPDDIPDHMETFREVPAGDNTPYPQWAEEEEAGVGGAGDVQQGELLGEVVRAEEDRLWLRHGGAVFPITLSEETRFTPNRSETLQPGQEVRTRFLIEEEGYTATSVESAGQGAPEKKPRREAPEK